MVHSANVTVPKGRSANTFVVKRAGKTKRIQHAAVNFVFKEILSFCKKGN